MNRKIAAWTIAAVAVLGLTACSGAPSASDEGSDEITSSEAPAENTAEDTGDQSVADACKVATEDITAATASLSNLDLEAATADPQGTLDTFTATTDALGTAVESVNNAEVKDAVTAIHEDFTELRDLLSAVLIDQDLAAAEGLTTMNADLQTSAAAFYTLCTP